MNKVILIGRLVRDPEVKYTESGLCTAKFGLAVDRRYKKDGDGQTADFPRIVAFGKTAEFVEKYFSQGKKIVIEGRVQTGSYDNKEGQKVYTTDVIAEQVEFAESKNTSSDGDSRPASRPTPSSASSDGFMNIPDGLEDEGLPFS